MLVRILRKIGLVQSRRVQGDVSGADDQTYTEAVMDNAIRAGDETLAKLSEATASTQRTNEILSREIERITVSQRIEPMQGLLAKLHHMGGKNGNV
jgi:hypothetical protein